MDGASDLVREVELWIRVEGENLDLKNRVASALDEIKGFISEHQSLLEKRKDKLLQSSGFRNETRSMEAALARIHQLFVSGRNISHIFSEVDKYLGAYKVDDTLSRLHTRVELADARDDYLCAFHDSIRGTRLSKLLDVLYFMPFAYWRSRGLERRNYRSPSAVEILKLLEELGRLSVDVNQIDTVLLAAIIRMKLGITPRMDYHNMSSNKLAIQLADGETLTRFTSQAMPLDESFCRTTGGILANVRRWSAEFFSGTAWQTPAEIEAEMLQIVLLAADTVRISGTEPERSTDYLWLLSTVIASDHTTLKDVLAWPAVKNSRFPSVYERILGTKTYLDNMAVLADRILAARWVAAKDELNSLTARSDGIISKDALDYAEFTELEQLKEKRSDVGKSLIKISDSLQLLEPACLDMLTTRGDHAGLPPLDEYLRTLNPAALMGRNRSYSEETKLIARQELDKLRVLIGRMAAISRKGLATSAAQENLERLRASEKPSRKTSGGVDIGKISTGEIKDLLLGSLRKAAGSVRDSRSKVEGARKRSSKSDLLHALGVLHDKIRKAADACDKLESDAVAGALAPNAAETMVLVLREIMSAQTSFSTRLNNAKLTPAEKQPLTTTLYAIKSKLNDDLRDIECLRAEIAERSAETAAHGEANRAAETAEAAIGAAPPENARAAAAGSREKVTAVSAGNKIAALASSANNALRPVKDRIIRLSTELTEQKREYRTILAASSDLKDTVAKAREKLSGSLAIIEAIAANWALPDDEYVGRYGRWQSQLTAIDEETERLLKVTECFAEIEEAVRAAAALEEEMSDERTASGEGGADGRNLDSRCSRCADALETIAYSLKRLQAARGMCVEATRAEWRLLRASSAYLESCGSDLEAYEAALNRSQSWFEDLRTILCS